jgi:hypothetical protein
MMFYGKSQENRKFRAIGEPAVAVIRQSEARESHKALRARSIQYHATVSRKVVALPGVATVATTRPSTIHRRDPARLELWAASVALLRN